jgi:hypothetical protein
LSLLQAETHYKNIMQEKVLHDIRNQEMENEKQKKKFEVLTAHSVTLDS